MTRNGHPHTRMPSFFTCGSAAKKLIVRPVRRLAKTASYYIEDGPIIHRQKHHNI
jgi:hypothetical protein